MAQAAKLKRVERAGWVVWAVVIVVALAALLAVGIGIGQEAKHGEVRAAVFSYCLEGVIRSGVTLPDSEISAICEEWQTEAFQTNEQTIMDCSGWVSGRNRFAECLAAAGIEPPN